MNSLSVYSHALSDGKPDSTFPESALVAMLLLAARSDARVLLDQADIDATGPDHADFRRRADDFGAHDARLRPHFDARGRRDVGVPHTMGVAKAVPAMMPLLMMPVAVRVAEAARRRIMP